MNLAIRSTFFFKYKEPQIEILKDLSSKLTPIKLIDFRAAHGEMLDLLMKNWTWELSSL